MQCCILLDTRLELIIGKARHGYKVDVGIVQDFNGFVYPLLFTIIIVAVKQMVGRHSADRANELRCKLLLVIQLILDKQRRFVLIARVWLIASSIIIP